MGSGPGWPGRLREAFDKFVTDLEANPGSYNVEDKSNDKVTVGLSAGSPNVVYASDRAKPLLERKIGPDEYKRDIGPAISRNADVKTLHDYTIEQAQKMHSLQVRKLFTYLRADPHANYNAKYFDNPVAPFVREANVFAHGFSLAFDALAIRGKRPLARTTKTAREDETARQSFIAIYRMAPEEALELVRLAVLRGESWATSNGPSRDMLRHINFIDGYFNWRNVFLEADRVLEPGVSHNIELEEWSMFTKVIMEVDPLFEAFLEAVYITARALQNVPGRNVSFANTVNDKAGLIKKRIVDFLNTDKIVGWVTLSETGASLDNVGSGDFARDFTKWAADPIRREPLAAYRNMLPATVRKLPDKKAPWDGDVFYNWTANPRRAQQVEDILAEYSLIIGQSIPPLPPPARAPGPGPALPRRPPPAPPAPALPRPPPAPGSVSYARAAKKRKVAQNPYDEDDSFFDDSSDGYDEEETPVNRVMNSAASSNKRRALPEFESQHGASKRKKTG
ncbi:hypothetical protein PG988_011173 [Apiospora saccharicola]